MASSGVWENVYLTITPTFVGVCGMWFLLILVGIFCQILACLPFYCILFEYVRPTFLDVGCDRYNIYKIYNKMANMPIFGKIFQPKLIRTFHIHQQKWVLW